MSTTERRAEILGKTYHLSRRLNLAPRFLDESTAPPHSLPHTSPFPDTSSRVQQGGLSTPLRRPRSRLFGRERLTPIEETAQAIGAARARSPGTSISGARAVPARVRVGRQKTAKVRYARDPTPSFTSRTLLSWLLLHRGWRGMIPHEGTRLPCARPTHHERRLRHLRAHCARFPRAPRPLRHVQLTCLPVSVLVQMLVHR